MNIKNLVVDMDGTLLNTAHEIMPKTKEALIKLQEEGIQLIIATGRPIETITEYSDELRLAEFGGYIIANNGAQIINPKTNEVVFEDLLSVDQLRNIFEILEKTDLIYYLVYKDTIYIEDFEKGVVDTGDIRGVINIFEYEQGIGNYKIKEVNSLKEDIDFSAFKILTTASPEYMSDHYDEIMEELGDDLTAVQSSPFVLEVMKKGISKGNALEHLDIDLENTLAFGDSFNDYHMLEIAGHSVAMANAEDEVKAVCKYETDSNDNEGIYKALKKFGLVE